MMSIGTERGASRSRRVALLGALGLAASLAAAAPGEVSNATADEPPLVLSSEHIGMSADQIESTQAAVAEEAPIVLRGPEPAPETSTSGFVESEFVSAEGAIATGCADASGGSPGITSFGHCVEASIRGGIGFEDSARVCRALFPELR